MSTFFLKTKRNRLIFASLGVLIAAILCLSYKLYSDQVRASYDNSKTTYSSSSQATDGVKENTSSSTVKSTEVSQNSSNSNHLSSLPSSANSSTRPKVVPIMEIKMPSIMYHHIRSWQGAHGDIEKSLRVSPAVFERHLEYIKNQGYTTVNTYDLEKYIKGEKELPAKPILLTFDDGYDDNYTYAFKLLQKHGMTGDFAIITNLVGKPDYLNWDQIREMDSAGMSISSHTLNHCALAKRNSKPTDFKRSSFQESLPDTTYKPCSHPNSGEHLTIGQIKNELVESKKIIEEKLGHKINTIIYPFGGYNTKVVELAKEVGYTFGFTISPQYKENINLNEPFDIPRYRGFGQDDNGPLKGFFAGSR